MAIQIAAGQSPAMGYLEQVKRKQPEMGTSFTPAPAQAMVRPNATPVAQVQTPPTMVRPNATPTPQTSVTPPVGGVIRPNATPVEAGTTTVPNKTAEQMYVDRVTQSLKTPDASSVAAQQTEDTAASRREYNARRNTEDALAQSPFGAGTAQYQRAMTESQAGVNRANQDGQNAVSAYIRQQTENNMNRARDLGQTTYNRGRDTLGDTLAAEKLVYDRGQTQIDRNLNAEEVTRREKQQQFENETVLKSGTDTDKRNLLNSLPEGPAKNAVMRGLADGSLTPATALAQVMNPDGTIKDAYRGKTPGALGLDAQKEEAIITLRTEAEAKGLPFDPNTPEGVKAVAAKVIELRQAKAGPITKEARAADVEAIKEKIVTGEALTPEESTEAIKTGAIPEFTAANLGGYKDQKVADLVGKPINIGGQVYTVVKGGRTRTGSGTTTVQERHTDWTEIKDSAGKSFYVYGGKINAKAPKEVSNDFTPFGW